MITQDEYGTVVNSEATYKALAEILSDDSLVGDPRESVIFAWTDGEGTQLDILLTYMPRQFGYLQRGMNASTDLFVSVSSFGMFGFEMNGRTKDGGYVGSKLGLGQNVTSEKLADLINGVIGEL